MGRYDRQILMFGDAGQQRLAAVRVTIVGLGGLGSHVAQQLAYLGVRHFALVDGDVVEDTNLNRLIGASARDAQRGRRKVNVAVSVIRRASPGAEVHKVPHSFLVPKGLQAIRDADYVVGCVDDDGARFALTAACAAYGRRYMDIATDIDETSTPLAYGGRAIFSRGEGCCACLGELDDREVRAWMASDAERRSEDKIYGRGAAGASPAVVCLNGVLASVACVELMADITGLRAAKRFLYYDGSAGTLRLDTTPPAPWCPHCEAFRTGNTEHWDWLRGQLTGKLSSGGGQVGHAAR